MYAFFTEYGEEVSVKVRVAIKHRLVTQLTIIILFFKTCT